LLNYCQTALVASDCAISFARPSSPTIVIPYSRAFRALPESESGSAAASSFTFFVMASLGIIVGIAYYLLMSIVHDPITLAAAQLLNAWSFATVSGIGITLFLEIIPRPGLASGLYTNTRRIGAIISGGIFALAGTGAGFSGVFLTCAALTAVALVITLAVNRPSRGAVRDAADSGTDSASSAIATGSVATSSGAA
jgi:hypothetical protein